MLTGSAVGAHCIICNLGMSTWTTVNGHPCCEWCRPKDQVAFQVLVDALKEISESKWRIETCGTHTGPTAEAHIAKEALEKVLGKDDSK